MTVVGFTFSKICVVRRAVNPKNLEIKSSIKLKNVEKSEAKLLTQKDTLRLEFAYSIEYAPGLANIDFEGHVLAVFDPKDAEAVLAKWGKEKEVDEDIKLRVFNTIFQKCNVKAFSLEEDFNLPLHLKLPQIRAEDKK